MPIPIKFSNSLGPGLLALSLLVVGASSVQADPINVFHDLTGSYGVNLFGYDFYKECMRAGTERVAEPGPVRGGSFRSPALRARPPGLPWV